MKHLFIYFLIPTMAVAMDQTSTSKDKAKLKCLMSGGVWAPEPITCMYKDISIRGVKYTMLKDDDIKLLNDKIKQLNNDLCNVQKQIENNVKCNNIKIKNFCKSSNTKK